MSNLPALVFIEKRTSEKFHICRKDGIKTSFFPSRGNPILLEKIGMGGDQGEGGEMH
jgi:hypothetical protein